MMMIAIAVAAATATANTTTTTTTTTIRLHFLNSTFNFLLKFKDDQLLNKTYIFLITLNVPFFESLSLNFEINEKYES